MNSPDEISEQLDRLSRQPFRDVLSRMLSAEPTPQAVKRFATKAPDRWAQSVTQLAKLSGYSEKLEVDASLAVTVNKLSDAELMEQLESIRAQLQNNVIEINPSDNPQSDQQHTSLRNEGGVILPSAPVPDNPPSTE